MDHEPMSDDEYAAALAYLERFTAPHAPQMTGNSASVTSCTRA